MEHEREKNFIWALEKLKELFASEKLLSNALVTNRELTFMNIMEVVFPNSTHLFCMFHISKKVSMKCKEYVESHRHEHVMDLWNNIYLSTKCEFLVHLKHVEVVCVDIPKCVQYMHETWLTSYQERFVIVWTNRVTHLGNTITNEYIDMTLNMGALLIIK